jgi:hypothetical protein
MANRNKQAGSKLELDVIHLLKDMGYDAVSARYASRMMDDRGIDIVSESFPFKIQCKASINQPNIDKIFSEKECDLIVFRKMKKQNSRFFSQGDYAMLRLDDFLDLVGVKSSFTEKDKDDE